jgi:hypothetical protein
MHASEVFDQIDEGPTKTAAGSAVSGQAAEYRALLAQPPEKLAELGRARAVKLLAELKYGRAIAKGEAREKNLEHTHVELMAKFDGAKKGYVELRNHVEAEMEKIRQQFTDDPAQCDRQLMALIRKHRPRALQLSSEASICKTLASATDERLSDIRQHLVTVNRERDLLAQGHKFSKAATPHALVELGLNKETLASFGLDKKTLSELGLDADTLSLDGLGGGSGTKSTVPVPPVSRQEVQQAMEEFRKLF